MVAEQDLGSSLLFFTLFVVMMWVSTERASYLVIGLMLFSGAAFAAWRLFDHVQTRVAIWRNPWPQYEGKGYQIVQAMFAFANGGTGGTGLGLGSPNKIPVAKTDFIFAAIGEELGLLGTTAILIGFLLMIGGGLRIAIRADRAFEKLLATGLTTIVGMQAFIIIGGVTRVVPLTGIALPFVSYGGSSLLANYVLLALLVRVSDSTARRLGETPNELTTGRAVRGLPAATSGSEGKRMNKQIRRLAVALLACYLVLFVQLNVLAVGRQQELNADPRNNRQTERDFNRPRGAIVAADGTVLARSVPTPRGDQFRYQREYPTGDLFGNVTGYYTFSFGSTQLERTAERRADGRHRRAEVAGDRWTVQRHRQHRQRVADDAARCATGRRRRARHPRGLGRRDGPAHRCSDRDDQQPALQPRRRRGAQLGPGGAGVDVPQRRARQAAAGQRVPRAVHAGFELQGHHHLDRSRGRGHHARSGLPQHEFVRYRRRPPTRSRTSAATVCGGTMVEVFYRSCNIPFAQLATRCSVPS